MNNALPCPCGCTRPVVLWIGSPAVYRVACSLCTRTISRQPTEAGAVQYWNEYVTSNRVLA